MKNPVEGGSRLASLFDGGAGVILDPFPTGYDAGRKAEEATALRSALLDHLIAAGVQPYVTVGVEGREGPGLPGVEVVCWTRHDARYVGLLNDGPARTVRLTIPEARTVHDVRSGQTLGTVDAWDCELAEGDAAVYAIFSERPRRVMAMQPTQPVRPGYEYRFRVAVEGGNGARPGHVLAVTVTDPRGVARPEYALVVTAAEDGWAEIETPFALNDPPGDWGYAIRDVATGLSTTATLELQSPPK